VLLLYLCKIILDNGNDKKIEEDRRREKEIEDNDSG
jgi:hypothetical protein